VTRLRKMMLEELERRNYSASTTRNYLRFVERFAQHFGKSPDKLGPDDLRSYQAYLLRERKLCPGTVENHVAALRFFFVRTLRRHEFREFLPYPKSARKLPSILSQEEVERLINASSDLFEPALLMASPAPATSFLPANRKRLGPTPEAHSKLVAKAFPM
jgi:integrase/recombinase XerD